MRSQYLVSTVASLSLVACSGNAPVDAAADAHDARVEVIDVTTSDAETRPETGFDATVDADASEADALDDVLDADSNTAPDATDDVAEDVAADVASDAADDAGLVRLTNAPETTADCTTVITPSSSELNHWAAVRLTPPSYPFHVRRIQYTTAAAGGCRAGNGHTVDLYRGMPSQLDPPSSPAIIGRYSVTDISTTSPRVITIDLPTDVVLNTDESLFIAIQLTWAPGYPPLCLYGCTNADTERNFISNSQFAPFIWLDPGRDRDFLVEAFGVPE